MKHVKIIITLTVTVVLFTLAVFGVEKLTTPVIDAELLRIANEAKFDVLPTLDEEADKDAIQTYYALECPEDDEDCNDSEYDLSGLDFITKVFVIPEKGYIYEVEFRGFSSDISYLVALDIEGNVTGFNVVSQNETAGLGDQILNTEFLESFRGLSSDSAENGDIELDGLAGATPWITIGGLKNSLNEVMVFHKVEFGGAVVETPEQKLARYYEEITAEGAVFTDISADNTLPEGVTKMELANNGEIDFAVVYTVEFATDYTTEGEINEYIFAVSLEDGRVLGLRVLEANDSAGIGAEIIKDAFNEQFVDMSQDVALSGADEQAGASYIITLAEFNSTLADAINLHKSVYDGVVILTPEEKLAQWILGIAEPFGEFVDKTDEYTLENGVTNVDVLELAGEDFLVMYTVEYEGYLAENSVYKVVMHAETGSVIGVYFVEANDSPGFGADIDAEEFLTQFKGMTQEDADNGAFDSQAGATYPVTLGAFKSSLKGTVMFHMENFQGVIFETYEEMIARYKTELAGAEALTDVTGDYDLSGTMVTTVETNTDSVLFTVVFQGYYENKDTIYLVGFDQETGDLNGIRVIEAGDSTGIGKLIIEDVFNVQFDGITQDDALAGGFDEQAGASYPITLAKFEESLADAVNFYKVEFGGETVETYEEMVARYYEELSAVDAIITDDSGNHTLLNGVTKVELANNGSEDFAVILTVEFTTAYTAGGEVNEYIISFDLATGEVLGVRFLQANDTAGIGADIMNEDFYTQFTDITKATAQSGGFDEQAGASYPQTLVAFESSVDDAVDFYVQEYEAPERPANIPASEALLLQAYPTAVSFVEVYDSYTYQEGIGNIYAAYDGGGALIGVVYVGTFQGNSGVVYFGWGIELATGTTQELSIYIEGETWDQNTDNYDDATWGTDFQTTPYLDQYEGINMTSIMFSPIDDIAGVSTTTGGLNATLETIVEYHLSEIVGGAN